MDVFQSLVMIGGSLLVLILVSLARYIRNLNALSGSS